VTRVDPATNAVQAVVSVPMPASVLAVGAGSIWLTSFPGNTVTRIDPATNTVTGSVSLAPSGLGPIGITVYAGYVWVANHDGDPTSSVTKIDPVTLNIVNVIPIGSQPFAGPTKIVSALGSLWTNVPSMNAVVRIDPTTDAITATIPSRGACADMAGNNQGVWVANDGGSGCQGGYPGISRIDPNSNTVTAMLNAGGATDALALDGATLWYGTTHSNFLGRVDTANNAIVGQLKLPGPVFSLAVGYGSIWATDSADGLLFKMIAA
jgi:DNA-binding beta-propeller fold protein YncE